MNDEGILFLSTVLELLFVFSVVFALLVLWMNARSKRAAKLRQEPASPAQPAGAIDKDLREQP